MQRKAFTDAERIKIARLHLDGKRPIKSLSEEFGISVSTISRWIIMYRNKGSGRQSLNIGSRKNSKY